LLAAIQGNVVRSKALAALPIASVCGTAPPAETRQDRQSALAIQSSQKFSVCWQLAKIGGIFWGLVALFSMN
jgi:hypothetical protein